MQLHENLVICEKFYKTNRQALKLFMLCVYFLSVLEPPVLLHNLTDCTVNASSSVSLSCPSKGVPPPTITWYKDERALTQGSGE